jgi:PhzF family phenazine biosynthesis protein
MARAFSQVDVFTAVPYLGNPVAVVHDAAGLDDAALARFARWTNLSETTFVLPPTTAEADYRVRIFTPVSELPFAGHPTLGTCHAWLEAGGEPRDPGVVIQECAAGLIRVRRDGDGGLAFAEPPLIRSGDVDDATLDHIADVLRLPRAAFVASQWVDNGPGWVAVLLSSAAEVLALEPGFVDLDLGVVGPSAAGGEAAFEVRAFFPVNGATVEDPVTGSLNASLAGWLIRSGRASAPWTAAQGTAIGRAGRVRITRDADGVIWTGGSSVTCVRGEVEL